MAELPADEDGDQLHEQLMELLKDDPDAGFFSDENEEGFDGVDDAAAVDSLLGLGSTAAPPSAGNAAHARGGAAGVAGGPSSRLQVEIPSSDAALGADVPMPTPGAVAHHAAASDDGMPDSPSSMLANGKRTPVTRSPAAAGGARRHAASRPAAGATRRPPARPGSARPRDHGTSTAPPAGSSRVPAAGKGKGKESRAAADTSTAGSEQHGPVRVPMDSERKRFHDSYFELLYEDAKHRQATAENPVLPVEEQFPFQPEISAYARRIQFTEPIEQRSKVFETNRQRKRAELAARLEQEAEAELTFQPNVSQYSFSGERRSFLREVDKFEARRSRRLEELRREQEEKELADATFKPQISEYSRRIAPRENAWERLARTPRRPESNGTAPDGTLRPGGPDATGAPGFQPASPSSRSNSSRSTTGRPLDYLYHEAESRRKRQEMHRAAVVAGEEQMRSQPLVNARSARLAQQRYLRQCNEVYQRRAGSNDALDRTAFIHALQDIGLFRAPPPPPQQQQQQEQQQQQAESALTQEERQILDTLLDWLDPGRVGAVTRTAWDLMCKRVGTGPVQNSAGTGSAPPSPSADAAVPPAVATALHRLAFRRMAKPATPTAADSSQAAKTATTTTTTTSRGGNNKRYIDLYAMAAEQRATRERLAKEREEAAAAECTFKPRINRTSTAAASAARPGPGRHDTWSRLHATPTKKHLPQAPPTREERELAECTFQPDVSSSKKAPKPSHKPRDYEAAIARVREANAARKRKEEEDHRRLHRWGNQRLSLTEAPPLFSFLTRKPAPRRGEALMYVDVDLGGGRTGRIGIHKGDTAPQLAHSFSSIYHLDRNATDQLCTILQTQIEPVVESLRVDGAAVEGTILRGSGQHRGGLDVARVTWLRQRGDDVDSRERIGTPGSLSYRVQMDDIGARIVFQYVPIKMDDSEGQGREFVTDQVVAAPPGVSQVLVQRLDPGNVMSPLRGSGIYHGGSAGTPQYVWQRVYPNGDVVDIDGAVTDTYEPTRSDVGAQLRFGFVPVRSDGEQGECVFSAPTPTIETNQPEVLGPSLVGRTVEGGTVRFAAQRYDRCDEGTCGFQWSRRRVDESTFAPVPGATSPSLVLALDSVGCVLRCECTPRDAQGRVGDVVAATASGAVLAGLPRFTSIDVQGVPQLGSMLTVRLVYAGGVQGASRIQWMRREIGDGSTRQPIPQAGTGTSYRCCAEDPGMALAVQVTPVRDDGMEGSSDVREIGVVGIEPGLQARIAAAWDSGGAEWTDLQLRPTMAPAQLSVKRNRLRLACKSAGVKVSERLSAALHVGLDVRSPETLVLSAQGGQHALACTSAERCDEVAMILKHFFAQSRTHSSVESSSTFGTQSANGGTVAGSSADSGMDPRASASSLPGGRAATST